MIDEEEYKKSNSPIAWLTNKIAAEFVGLQGMYWFKGIVLQSDIDNVKELIAELEKQKQIADRHQTVESDELRK